MVKGTVKWFDDSTGYGFIVPDSGVEDLFVKHSSVAGIGDNPLVKGARVSFDRCEGTKGPEATNVVTSVTWGAAGATPRARSRKARRVESFRL